MKKILCASFLTLLLSSCMQHYYVVRTEGTGIKAYNSESTDIYLTEPYKGNPKQGGRIYVRKMCIRDSTYTLPYFFYFLNGYFLIFLNCLNLYQKRLLKYQ